MGTSYFPTHGMIATVLNAETPLGLFHAIRHNEVHRFLIVERRGVRSALKLDHFSAGRLWVCGDDTATWQGLSLGLVELELDLSSTIEGQAGIMHVNVTSAGAGICAIFGSAAVDVHVSPVQAASESEYPAFTAPRWRLIQRRGPGDIEVVYEHGSD